jgi:tRNA-Thr(GGU) m(6)t(6)A37 methyltransferase TsaA
MLFSSACQKGKVSFRALGYFISEYTPETGAPRQGRLMPATHGQIVLHKEYEAGLNELTNFEYIWVIYHFDKAEGWDSELRPPESHKSFGVFASRSPRRPNALGLSLVKLDSLEKNILFVSGIDMFNGTPVLDIKPYLPSVDLALSLKNIKAEELLGHHEQDFLNDTLVRYYIKGDSTNIDSLSTHH